MINIIEGNLLDATEDIIGHQVNCKGAMNSGVAKCIREKYPEVYKEYKNICKNEEFYNLIGGCQLVTCYDGKIIANLFGQKSYGYDKKQYTDLPALIQALNYLKIEAKSKKLSVALPYNIGCCRGGANWNEVYFMINKVFQDYNLTLYKLDNG